MLGAILFAPRRGSTSVKTGRRELILPECGKATFPHHDIKYCSNEFCTYKNT